MENKEYDYINPSHYKQGGKETIEKMVDIWGPMAVAIHCEITAFKYMERLGAKPDQPKERDLAKARWYLNKAEELQKRKCSEIISTIHNHVSASTIAPSKKEDGYSITEDESTWSERKKATFKFFDEFPEPWRSKAIKNYNEYFHPDIPSDNQFALNWAFNWLDSPEGGDYWSDFYSAL